MSNIARMMQRATAGAGGAGLDVNEVFSTYLYDGTGANQTITNNIDLSGEGGLVWLKSRNGTSSAFHTIYDTARGTGPNGGRIFGGTASTNASSTQADGLQSFNSNGFTLGANLFENGTNASYGTKYCSWTFRKAPKFFDVVTYSGNSQTSQTIAHSLGSAPGMMFVKRTDGVGIWWVYHRDVGATKILKLQSTQAEETYSGAFNDTAPTATHFTVGSDSEINYSGRSYVAYLFAHNNSDGEFGPDADQDIIKCGSFNTPSSGDLDVSLGFEPQFILFKRSDASENWGMRDVMRGMSYGPNGDARLWPNLASQEFDGDAFNPTPTGFTVQGGTDLSYSANYIYMAIRRGPMAVPESATDVFQPHIYTGDGSTRKYNLSITPDMVINRNRSGAGDASAINDRLRGSGREMYTSDTGAEASYPSLGMQFDHTNAIEVQDYRDTSGTNYLNLCWKRAPGYFDIVAYTGTGVAGRTVNHNLGVAPAMVWLKCRSVAEPWRVFHKDLGIGSSPYSKILQLNENSAAANASDFQQAGMTSSVITLGGELKSNGSGRTYVAYLFATLPGITKLGTFSTTGSDVNVDCGFSSGARFVLLKRTDGTGAWNVFDTARGIVAGNDPYIKLHTTTAEVTGSDLIDPLSSGFTVVGGGFSSGETFIFYAVA